MKSRAAVAHRLRSPFVVEEVELPDLQPTDVLVRIVAVGVCHTDVARRDGQLPAPFLSVRRDQPRNRRPARRQHDQSDSRRQPPMRMS
jgi:NADPH:quinone reductase-like Zn-dependent oxidoreductase